jgi:hypothetical protein
MADGTAVNVNPFVRTSSPWTAPAHLSMRKIADPHEFRPSANRWPVYPANASSHRDTSLSSALATLYRNSRPLSMHATAASTPAAGTYDERER